MAGRCRPFYTTRMAVTICKGAMLSLPGAEFILSPIDCQLDARFQPILRPSEISPVRECPIDWIEEECIVWIHVLSDDGFGD